tara:strand:- start:115 stop:1203 length:1089 start_codon:yes stop_codon:yes gene_type:complete
MLRFKQFLKEVKDPRTDNASITELFPCLAFNKNYRPSNVEDFKRFLYQLGGLKSFLKSTFVNDEDRRAGEALIGKMGSGSMEERFVKTKVENAIGITNYLFSLHSSKPIKQVVWGYRNKPRGIPNNHAGDIFVFFKNKETLGISLKAGTAKSTEPLLNSYVKTQLGKIGRANALKPMEDEMWDAIYSKIPSIESVATKDNYADGDRKRTLEIRKLYLDFHVADEITSNELYIKQTTIQRQHFCKALNTLSLEEFKDWVSDNFNLQKPQKVPLVLVKAVGTKAEQKGDDLASLLPLVSKFNAYLNPKSVQEWFIDIDTPDELKKLKMTIRSDAGVREGKNISKLGRLAKFSMLKLQYSGVLNR